MSKRYGTVEDRFWRLVDRSGDCWLWVGSVDRYGYGLFRAVNVRSQPTERVRAHRFAYAMAHGVAIPDELVVRHRCDNPGCVRPEHLLLGTTADNVKDRTDRGRSACGDRNGSRLRPERLRRGEDSSCAKLTAEQVREIRSRYVPRKLGYQRLASEYGVSMATVHEIIERKTWKHLD